MNARSHKARSADVRSVARKSAAFFDLRNRCVELGLRQARVGANTIEQILDRAAHVLEVLLHTLRVEVARTARHEGAGVDFALDRDADGALRDRLIALHALRA